MYGMFYVYWVYVYLWFLFHDFLLYTTAYSLSLKILEQAGLLPESQCGFQKDREQLTWSSQQGSFKKNGRNRMWTSTWPLSTFPKHLIQSFMRDVGKSWQSFAVRPTLMGRLSLSLAVHSNGAAVPWWHLAQVQNVGQFSDPFLVTKAS